MENKKLNNKILIVILSGILVSMVFISGCIQNEIKEQNETARTNEVLPDDLMIEDNQTWSGDLDSDQINKTMPGPDIVDINDTVIMVEASLDDETVYIPENKMHSNVTRIGKIGPNNRTYYNYINKDNNFSIDFPDDWAMLPEKSKIVFISPKRFESGYISMEMQLLTSSDSGGTYNSEDEIIADLIHGFENKENVSNVTINYKRDEVISGVKGKELNISYRRYGFNYTQPHIIVRGGKYFYVISYIAQTEHFSEDADVYEYTKGHFKLENK